MNQSFYEVVMSKIIGAFIFIFSFSALASYLPIVRNPKFYTEIVNNGPVLKTKTYLSVVISSCAKREELKIEKDETQDALQVRVIDINSYDCRTRGIDREYKLDLGALNNWTYRFILQNPIGLEK